MSIALGKKIVFRLDIVVEPDEGQYHAYCPALKGLQTCGDTVEEALNHAKDAAMAYLHSLIKHGDPIPLEVIVESAERKKAYSSGKRTRYTEDLAVAVA